MEVENSDTFFLPNCFGFEKRKGLKHRGISIAFPSILGTDRSPNNISTFHTFVFVVSQKSSYKNKNYNKETKHDVFAMNSDNKE